MGDAEEKSSGDSESTDDEDVRFAVRASASKNSHPMRVHSEDEEDDGLSPNAPDAAPQSTYGYLFLIALTDVKTEGKRVRWTSSTRPRSPAASQSEVPPSPSLSSSSSQSPPPSTPTPHDVDPVHGGSNQEATPVSPQAKRKGPPRAVPRTICKPSLAFRISSLTIIQTLPSLTRSMVCLRNKSSYQVGFPRLPSRFDILVSSSLQHRCCGRLILLPRHD